MGYLADRLIGRGNQHVGIFAPHLFLGLVVEQGQLIGVAADHPKHPAGRHAAFGQSLLHFKEYVGVHFKAAPALGLNDLEEAGGLHFGDGFSRHVAIAYALARARF